MIAAVAVLGVLVALGCLFIVALLRSHAEILRRLAQLEEAVGAAPAGLEPMAMDSRRAGGAAHPIAGETLAGDGVGLALGAGSEPTLLAFLSSGCSVCQTLWGDLRARPGVATEVLPGARLVVVTKGPERERLGRLVDLAPAELEVVMSTTAWQDYAVPATPHFVLVDGGEIAGRGSASSWEQVADFLADARRDDAIHATRSLSTSARAERAERALADAGITAGHPSLYPSRRDDLPDLEGDA
jgi:hypothetical protein